MYRRSSDDLSKALCSNLERLKDRKAHPLALALSERGIARLHVQVPPQEMTDEQLKVLVLNYRQQPDPDTLNRLLDQTEGTVYKAVRKEGWLQEEFVLGSDDWAEAMQLGRTIALDTIVSEWVATKGVPLRAYLYELVRFRLKDWLRAKRRYAERHETTDPNPKRDDYDGSLIDRPIPQQLQAPSAEQEAIADDLHAFARGVIAALDAAGHKSLATQAGKGHRRAVDRAVRVFKMATAPEGSETSSAQRAST